ncbi:hypothetical protein HDU79_009667 [Rhizoclosmatium sp. JEL0117]|nr:hypothetical protein HDU79_009667 [Rhizoclosmatium sp. JEL0117]
MSTQATSSQTTQLPSLTVAQAQYLDQFIAQIVALPKCAQACVFLYSPRSTDPLSIINSICQDQRSFMTTYNSCSSDRTDGCLAPGYSDMALEQAQSIVDAVPVLCAGQAHLFTANQTALGAFATGQDVDAWPTAGLATVDLGPVRTTGTVAPSSTVTATNVRTFAETSSTVLIGTTADSAMPTNSLGGNGAAGTGAKAGSGATMHALSLRANHSMQFAKFQATDGDPGNPRHGDHTGYGQNLAWQYSSSPFPSIPYASLVGLWNSEPIPTAPGTYNHVTQSLGCAVAAGKNPYPDPTQPAYLNDIILVCDYYLPGNWYGQQWNTAAKLTQR